MAKPKFSWTVVFEIDEVWVADGFDLTEERALDMIQRTLPYSCGGEVGAKVACRPNEGRIRRAQGYLVA